MPASATLSAGCTAQGTLLDKAGTPVPGRPQPYDAANTTAVTIPRTGKVKWSAAETMASGQRQAVGEVQVELPWPVGDVEIGQWGKDGKKTGSSSNADTYDYDFSPLLAGVKVHLHGRDTEPPVGGPGGTCTGAIDISIEGTSPVAWASLVLTVVVAMNLALSVRARKVGP